MPYGSEMNFYKIDDQNYVFSVRASINGAIRYYSMMIDAENNCVVKRIQNALAFITKHQLPKISEFTPDYAKVITSLISYCDYEQDRVVHSGKARRAIDYSRLPQYNNKGLAAVISSRQLEENRQESEDNSFYELDSEDCLFISNGIQTNNMVNSFRLK